MENIDFETIFFSILVELEHWKRWTPFDHVKVRIGTSWCCFMNWKLPPGKLTLTVVKNQQLADIGKTAPRDANFCRKKMVFSRREVCESFKTNKDNLNNAVHGYRGSWYLEDNETGLKWQHTTCVWQKEFFYWA